jgi:hypothetical protein
MNKDAGVEIVTIIEGGVFVLNHLFYVSITISLEKRAY